MPVERCLLPLNWTPWGRCFAECASDQEEVVGVGQRNITWSISARNAADRPVSFCMDIIQEVPCTKYCEGKASARLPWCHSQPFTSPSPPLLQLIPAQISSRG